MRFLKRISLRLKHIRQPPPAFRINHELNNLLHEIARTEQKPVEAIMTELLYDAAVARHQAHQNLRLWDKLSPREKQVAALTCMGFTNDDIAKKMVISPNTAKTHMRHVLDKCRVNSKVELQKVLASWDFQEWLDGQQINPKTQSSTA